MNNVSLCVLAHLHGGLYKSLEDLYLNWDDRFIVVSKILHLFINGYAAKKKNKIRFFCSSLKGDIHTWKLNSTILYFTIEHACLC